MEISWKCFRIFFFLISIYRELLKVEFSEEFIILIKRCHVAGRKGQLQHNATKFHAGCLVAIFVQYFDYWKNILYLNSFVIFLDLTYYRNPLGASPWRSRAD